MGVGVDPAQAHSLRIITSPVAGSRWQSGTLVPPDMCIEATPSGQGPLVHAHLPRYCVARSSSSSGVGALGRGPVEFISPCCAIHSLHDCLLGESGVHVGQCQPLCNWVSPSALSRVSEPGPPKRPPTRRLLLPRTGLAHGNMVHGTFDVPVTSGSGKSATASRDGPPPSSDGRSWPSVRNPPRLQSLFRVPRRSAMGGEVGGVVRRCRCAPPCDVS